MTRISEPQDVKCCICKTNNKVQFVYSTSIFGGPDLDTRPAFMARYNIIFEVNACKNCGYCNMELDKEIHGAKKVIQLSEYQKQLKKRGNPKKANEFSCLAMIYEFKGDIVQAGWQYLKAAWICDDKKMQKQGFEKIKADEKNKGSNSKELILTPQIIAYGKCAATFRHKATDKFQAALKINKPIMKTRGEERLLFTDINRRTGEFNIAEKICLMAQTKKLNQNIRRLLNYELHLCKIKDDTCHNIEDGMEYNGEISGNKQ